LGRPLIRRVAERAGGAKRVDRVVVATEDTRIAEAVREFGGAVMMTSPSCRTGTDRTAEVAKHEGGDLFINLQGDELIADPAMLDELIEAFEGCPEAGIGTLSREIREKDEVFNPNVVKVVTDRKGWALYFSRFPIPYLRGGERVKEVPPKTFYKHLGIYIYRRADLLRFAGAPTGNLEAHERLEQLRALEEGWKIRVWETRRETMRIDTEEDLRLSEQRLMT
jgi:3-deoxy-manno-octulosonate cytidylyltransferase (CMP-KDO synthetase)